MRRPRSLVARVEAMRDVAACLESFVYHRGGPRDIGPGNELADSDVCAVAESVAALMAEELDLLAWSDFSEGEGEIVKPQPAKKKASQ